MKVRKLFWEKCLEEDWSNIHWWSCFKGGKWEAENELQKEINMLYLRWNQMQR